jgi:PIN domain nuclease of toxin-antitoxin system
MRLLLDTHALLWWLGGHERLGQAAAGTIRDPTVEVLVSAASVWEAAIKRTRGKLRAPAGLLDAIARARLAELPVSARHAWHAGSLPLLHHDPFDRMLVAQAQIEGLSIVTADAQIAAYEVAVVNATL